MAVLPFDVFWRDHGAKAGLKGLSTEARATAKAQEEFKGRAVAAGALVGAALFKLGKDAVGVASDISESQSKVGVVFGKSAGDVARFAETSAKSMGISKAAYLEAAGTLGNLFVSLKLPQPEAAKMSTRMVQLASDLASFNNASPEEALDALRAGLLGETEPLRRFGVNLNDATLRQKALELGLVKTTKDVLPPAVKAQASYALILEQTKTAQGDFARTSGGLANSQRILKAEFSDLQGELGEKLLPAALAVTRSLVDLLDFVDAHGKTIGVLAGGFAAVAGGVIAVNKAAAGIAATSQAIETLTSAVASFRTEGGKGRTALTGLASFMTGPWGAATLVAGGALAIWAKRTQEAKQRVDSLKDSLEQATGAVTKNSRELAYNNLVSKGAVSAAKELGISLSDLTDAALGNTDAQDRINRILSDQAAAYRALTPEQRVTVEWAQRLGTNTRTVQDALGEQNAELQKARSALRDASAAGVVAAGTTDDLTGAVKTNTRAVDDNAAALAKRDKLLSKRDAQSAYEEAIDNLTASLKENGLVHGFATEKGRNNEKALDDLAKAAGEYKTKIAEAGGSTKDVNRVQEEARRRLRAAAEAMGYSKGKADALARSLLGIPAQPKSKPKVDTVEASNKVRALQRALDGLHGKTVTVGARLTFPKDWASYRAGERKAYGGQIGDGTGTVDDVPILAMRGEHMWTTREVQGAGGHGAVKRLRNAALAGRLKGYAQGGPIGMREMSASAGVGRLESNLEGLAVAFGRDLQRQLDAAGFGTLAGGWLSQWTALRKAFPGAQLFSSFRPGAITATGNQSYHALGRAIDVTPSMAIFDWVRRTYGARTKELIFSPAGGRQIRNGQPHFYGEPVRGMHWNHVHWAYDRGGMAYGPGWIPKGPAPERVLSPRQTAAFEQLVRGLDAGRGATVVNLTLSAPNYVGARRDLLNALTDLEFTGRLDRILGKR